jgi:hypothetical protein
MTSTHPKKPADQGKSLMHASLEYAGGPFEQHFAGQRHAMTWRERSLPRSIAENFGAPNW